ncbi:hypothetical protein ACFFRR_004317 [Megaselia abdita]
MFASVLLVILSILAGSHSLSCNEWSNGGCPNTSIVQVTCDVFNAIRTESQLTQYYNFSIISDPTSFKCMSLNSTMTPGGQVEIEGCVPADLNILDLPAFSFYNETKVTRATCLTDNCNNFNENGEIIPPINVGLQCYECNGQENCRNPSLVTCDYSNSLASIQRLNSIYTFDISSYLTNPPKTYSCYSTNTSFNYNGASGIWPDLIYKGCVFEGFSACSLPLNNQSNTLTQVVESCYTCDTDSCNKNERPAGYGTCYVCKNYPCLDEDVVTCDQSYANATYSVLGKMYSNVNFEVNDNFDCFALEASYSDQAIEYLGPVPIYYKGCVNSNFDACGLQTKPNLEEHRDYCLQCEGGKCNSNVNALKENTTLYVEMKV